MTALLFSCLVLTFLKIRARRLFICETNSGRSSESSICWSDWSCFSCSTGRTSVEQSLSGKTCLIRRLIRFLCSMASLKPFYSCRDCSKYSLELMGLPC